MTMSEFDNTPEGGAEEEGLPSPEERIALLQQALEQRTREAAEMKDNYLRTAADFDNYRKRMQREMADFRKYANEQMALDLLTVVDHLGLALKHAGESGETVQGLQEGVELVHKQLRSVLEKFGIKQFAAAGEPFDPARHDALMQVVTDELPENTVAQVMQDGYLYHDKVLRHAKVGVAKRPEAAAEAPAGQEEQQPSPAAEEGGAGSDGPPEDEHDRAARKHHHRHHHRQ
jgi:molecular chaperone GrpE